MNDSPNPSAGGETANTGFTQADLDRARAEAHAAGVKAGAEAERTRITGIYGHAEAAGHQIPQANQFVALKLDQSLAFRAVQMVMLRVAVVVFVDRTPFERKTAQQARLDELIERAIDGGPSDAARMPAMRELFQQRIGVEVIVTFEDVFDQQTLRLRKPLAATLQVFFESLQGR